MQPVRPNNRQIPQIEAAIDAFLLAKTLELRPKTVQWYEYELSRFADAIKLTELSELEASDIRAYLSELATHHNGGGVHCAFRAIKAWLNWSWTEFELEEFRRNPIAKVRLPRPQIAPIPGVSLKDFRKLLSAPTACPIRDRALLLCLLDCGARSFEFVALDWQDVDLLTGRVDIRDGKGGKPRLTFIGSRSRRALRAWKREQQPPDEKFPIWTTTRDSRMTRAGLREVIRRKAVAVGLKAVPSPHDFRRACVKAIIANGADVVTASRVAGHSDIRVTERYDAQDANDLLLAHAKASPVDNARL